MQNEQMPSFERTRVDWRGTIQANTRKTYVVMLLFFLTYTLFGYLLDLLIWVPPNVQAMGNDVRFYDQHPFSGTLMWVFAHFNACIQGTHIPYIVIGLQLVAIVSLLWTRYQHSQIMLLGTRYVQITALSDDPKQQQALNILNELKIAAGMSYLPKLFLIDSPTMNAFASGWDERNSMIAITQPLLNVLNRAELQAVLAHELSHIRHQDIKLTLTVTVLSNIMLIIVDSLFRNVLYGSNNRRGARGNRDANLIAVLVVTILHIVIPLINLLLIMYFSRTREYLAAAGAVALVRNNMGLAQALLKIQNNHIENQQQEQDYDRSTPHERLRYESYIYWPNTKSASSFFSRLFSTHPAIQDRLAAIGLKQKKP